MVSADSLNTKNKKYVRNQKNPGTLNTVPYFLLETKENRMDIFDVLSLVLGLSLFLYGMELMGDALKKSAGSSLKVTLGKMTSSPLKGFLLGLGVSALIQSSTATTVMVVGFVNSGTMTLAQAVGVIMGANVGTAVTSWLTGLSGLGESGQTFSAASAAIEWLKPTSWVPILALVGVILFLFAKRGRKKDVGGILLGFSILMVGMETMSASVAGLRESSAFRSVLVMFENPILGVLAGLLLTAIVQSSSASVGILQSLTATGAITFRAAIPIVMGQNIGTCVTALLSAVGAGRNGKRAALIHLYFNVIGVAFWLSAFYLIDWLFPLPFTERTIDMWDVALIHTVFKLLSVVLIAPFSEQLKKLAILSVPDKQENKAESLLDERLLHTPAVAVGRAEEVAHTMARLCFETLRSSLSQVSSYVEEQAEQIRAGEERADVLEDALGTYLIRLSAKNPGEADSREITKLLHLTGDFERITDYAVHITEAAGEMHRQKINFPDETRREISVMIRAIREILMLTEDSFLQKDLQKARMVEPLEQIVETLHSRIRMGHILRLQKNESTAEHGVILSELLTGFERVAGHCGDIAGCIIEISEHGTLDMHRYLGTVRSGSHEYTRYLREYEQEYAL